MRRILVGVFIILAASPAWAQTTAQTTAQNATQCGSSNPETAIFGCTALIATPHQTKELLVFAFNNRAWNYHLAGQDAKGLADVDKALLLDPADARVLETRAEIYEKLGHREQAVADYRGALKIDPSMKQAKDGLARLKAVP